MATREGQSIPETQKRFFSIELKNILSKHRLKLLVANKISEIPNI